MKTIKDSKYYVPFYNRAIALKLRKQMMYKEFVHVMIKGGRYSAKSWYVVLQITENLYRDNRRSAIVIAPELQEHYERGVALFDDIFSSLGFFNEWKWKSKDTRPTLWRNVNGYRQEIRFRSIKDIETSGFEAPINTSTGLKGFIGEIWIDEPAKHTDNRPDQDFANIQRLLGAVASARNTIIRNIPDDGGAIVTYYTLNPYGGENPVVQLFHKLLQDNFEKLLKEGYNLAYVDDEETSWILATTNYQINDKLDDKQVRAMQANLKEEGWETVVYGKTGTMLNADFSRELMMLEGLNRKGNVPDDTYFIPMNFSMDIGNVSTFYMNGVDSRYLVRAGGATYPTRLITKGEYTDDVKTDMRDMPSRYKDILRHIHRLSIRFPEVRRGTKGNKFEMFVDGSAIHAIELLKAFAVELENEEGMDFSWLAIVPQTDKWKTSERRTERRDKFSGMVASYGLIIDKHECPDFFRQTAKIAGTKSEQQYDHWYDGLMYGIMPLQDSLYTGMQIRARQQKSTEIKT